MHLLHNECEQRFTDLAVAEADLDDPQNQAIKNCAARMIVIGHSTPVVHLALRAVGSSSYFKRLPLERYFHDACAGLYHPPDSDETLEMLGRAAFGIPPGDEDALWA